MAKRKYYDGTRVNGPSGYSNDIYNDGSGYSNNGRGYLGDGPNNGVRDTRGRNFYSNGGYDINGMGKVRVLDDSASYDNPRRQEYQDFGMIREDHSAVANLPRNVMQKPYPRCPYGISSDLDDTIRGIDRQIGYDDDAAYRGRSRSKY